MRLLRYLINRIQRKERIQAPLVGMIERLWEKKHYLKEKVR